MIVKCDVQQCGYCKSPFCSAPVIALINGHCSELSKAQWSAPAFKAFTEEKADAESVTVTDVNFIEKEKK